MYLFATRDMKIHWNCLPPQTVENKTICFIWRNHSPFSKRKSFRKSFSFKLMVHGQWSVGRLDGHFLQARHIMYPLNHASNTLTASVPTILCFILPWRCREEEGWSLESRMFLLWMYNSIRVLIFGWVKHK